MAHELHFTQNFLLELQSRLFSDHPQLYVLDGVAAQYLNHTSFGRKTQFCSDLLRLKNGGSSFLAVVLQSYDNKRLLPLLAAK